MVLAAKKTRVESERGASIDADLTEAGFYASYDWCLNPRLTVDDQLRRLGEELQHGASLAPGWQRGEFLAVTEPKEVDPRAGEVPLHLGAVGPIADV